MSHGRYYHPRAVSHLDVGHHPGATRPDLVILEDLRAGEIPADLVVAIETAAAGFDVAPAAITHRAIERGLPGVIGELQDLRQLAAAWDPAPAAGEPLET